jgi:hypothetical protein
MTRRKHSPKPVDGFIRQLKQVFQSSQEAVIQYLTQEIKFLLSHLARRPKPTDCENAALARAAKAINPSYLEKAFNLFTPTTLYRWPGPDLACGEPACPELVEGVEPVEGVPNDLPIEVLTKVGVRY